MKKKYGLEVFCKNSPASNQTLKRLLREHPDCCPRLSTMHSCEGAGLGAGSIKISCQVSVIWLNSHIKMQLDHVNGDNTDNRPVNLRWLCPNCHSQTETYSGKNIPEQKRRKKEIDRREAVLKKYFPGDDHSLGL